MNDFDILTKQIEFIAETDRLKSVLRQTSPIGQTRQENSAEHSWQVVLCAITFQQHANEEIDLLKVIKMLTLHDIVEIDVGDTFHYDKAATKDLYPQELAAAKRIFSLLPPEQGHEFLTLWQEFEAKQTAEAKYAAAVDRIIALIMNSRNQGGSWQRHNITTQQVLNKNQHINDGSNTLWQIAQHIVDEAFNNGYIKKTKQHDVREPV